MPDLRIFPAYDCQLTAWTPTVLGVKKIRGPNNPMTRDQKSNGITADRTADRSGRGRLADAARYLTVGGKLSANR